MLKANTTDLCSKIRCLVKFGGCFVVSLEFVHQMYCLASYHTTRIGMSGLTCLVQCLRDDDDMGLGCWDYEKMLDCVNKHAVHIDKLEVMRFELY
jgi:hypothetical protein